MQLTNMPNWSIQRVLWLCFLPLVIVVVLMSLIFGLQLNQMDQTAYISLGVLTFIGIVVGITSVVVLSRMISKPIRGIIEGAEIVDSGKLDYRFNVDAKGEFGQLAFGLNRMLQDLKRSKDVLGESEENAWQILDCMTDSVV
jgi:nitrogen fixation/metabolism regulation signal transduction histidine kinase